MEPPLAAKDRPVQAWKEPSAVEAAGELLLQDGVDRRLAGRRTPAPDARVRARVVGIHRSSHGCCRGSGIGSAGKHRSQSHPDTGGRAAAAGGADAGVGAALSGHHGGVPGSDARLSNLQQGAALEIALQNTYGAPSKELRPRPRRKAAGPFGTAERDWRR